MHEFQVLTDAQETMKASQAAVVEKMRSVFSTGSTEIVVDGGGRRMPVEVRFICDGDQAGYLMVMPINGKRTRSCIRAVHWSQIDRTSGDRND